jgi:hypothetical protein
MNDLLSAALGYAERGIPVLPLHTPLAKGCYCGRRGCESPGKHPRTRHGLLDASTDVRQIRWWWRRWPQANVAVRTGVVMDVCDVDTNAGLRVVLDLLDVARPPGPTVRTGFGWHLWFAPTGQGNRVGALPGVDWRGASGTAVAPPSLHANGNRYQWAQPWAGEALPQCPAQLLRLITPPPVAPSATGVIRDPGRYAQAVLNNEIERIFAAPRPHLAGAHRIPGGRNSALNRAAFRLGQLAATDALDERDVWRRLTEAGLSVGLGEMEVRRTIASGWRAGLRRPRQ